MLSDLCLALCDGIIKRQGFWDEFVAPNTSFNPVTGALSFILMYFSLTVLKTNAFVIMILICVGRLQDYQSKIFYLNKK